MILVTGVPLDSLSSLSLTMGFRSEIVLLQLQLTLVNSRFPLEKMLFSF